MRGRGSNNRACLLAWAYASPAAFNIIVGARACFQGGRITRINHLESSVLEGCILARASPTSKADLWQLSVTASLLRHPALALDPIQ
jgi:hypothetical protein